MLKKILVFLLVVLLLMQFIHPAKNQSKAVQAHYIGTVHAVPAEVKQILEKACNDCHSNNTRYPWYARLQPFDWWMDSHVQEGKKELNLDEYSHRSLRYQYHKLEEIIEEVKNGKMPLESYTWTHKDARLTNAEKATLTGWAGGLMEGMRASYPLDSLVRKN